MMDKNTREIKIITAEEEVGLRLDKLLSSHCADISRVRIQKLIKSCNVRVNGAIISEPKYVMKVSDLVHLVFTEDNSNNELLPYNVKLSIVYEDDDLVVIDKPAGLTVHPGAGNADKTLANALFSIYGNNLSNLNGNFRLGILHRLDKDTSGLMIVAKNNRAHMLLAKQLEAREIEREYLAFIYGTIFPAKGSIIANIGRSKRDRTKMTVLSSGGRHAVTHYQVLKDFGESAVSLVKCKLETGRTHQIRVHMSFKKHPIIGDKVYQNSKIFNLNSLSDAGKFAVKALQRQALHAFSLKFIHPTSLQLMEFQSALPQDLNNLMQALETKNNE